MFGFLVLRRGRLIERSGQWCGSGGLQELTTIQIHGFHILLYIHIGKVENNILNLATDPNLPRAHSMADWHLRLFIVREPLPELGTRVQVGNHLFARAVPHPVGDPKLYADRPRWAY